MLDSTLNSNLGVTAALSIYSPVSTYRHNVFVQMID